MENTYTEIQSMQRAIDVLELIAESKSPISIKDIIVATKLPKPTVYRLLSNWIARNYVSRNSDGKYTLGLRLFSMGRQIDPLLAMKPIVKPFLQRLNNEFNETVHLGMLHENKVQYVDGIESRNAIRMVMTIGSTGFVHCTSLGKALLMSANEEVIRKILCQASMKKLTVHTITDVDEFIKAIEVAKIDGYALDMQEGDDDCCCIGAPIYDVKGMVIAAISVSGPCSRMTLATIKEDIAPLLVKTTKEISGLLG